MSVDGGSKRAAYKDILLVVLTIATTNCPQVLAADQTPMGARMSARQVDKLGNDLRFTLDEEHRKMRASSPFKGRADVSDIIAKIIPRGTNLKDAEAVLTAAGMHVHFIDTRTNQYHEQNPAVFLGAKEYDDNFFTKSSIVIGVHTKNARLADGVVDKIEALVTSTSL